MKLLKKEPITASEQVEKTGRTRSDKPRARERACPSNLSRACPSDLVLSTTGFFFLPEVGKPSGGEDRALDARLALGRGPRAPSATISHFIRMPLFTADRPNPPALFKTQPQRHSFHQSSIMTSP